MLLIINYKGYLISKLQNSVILLIFKVSKIRNMHFVDNLILNMSYKFYKPRHRFALFQLECLSRFTLHPPRGLSHYAVSAH